MLDRVTQNTTRDATQSTPEENDQMEVRLKSTPAGVPEPANFEVVESVVPDVPEGSALVETLCLSLDPYMRGQISGRHISGAVNPGDVMRGEAVSRVIKSRTPGLQEGDVIAAFTGWRSHGLVTPQEARPIGYAIDGADGLPASLALGVLGMPGLTAYAGLLRLGEPKPGDVLLVSSAAGAVGATVGQIGRIKGCRVIGIAGSPAKIEWLKSVAGFDDCINYKAEDLRAGLDRLCPPKSPPLGGVDIYFDNVGGDMLQAHMERLAHGARVVLCGLMAQYNSTETPPGPNPALIIKARATVRGMVVYDHEDLRADLVRDVGGWIRTGQLAYKEDLTSGLENARDAFCRLMRGETFGKVIIQAA